MGKSDKLNLETPAIYRIKVQGKLDSSYSKILNEMQINHEEKKQGETESLIVGKVADQAALSGVLNTLYELRMPVISVECIDRL